MSASSSSVCIQPLTRQKRKDMVHDFAHRLLNRLDAELKNHNDNNKLMPNQKILLETMNSTTRQQLEAAFSTPDNTWFFVHTCLMPFWKKNPVQETYFFDSEDLELQSECDFRKMLLEHPALQDAKPEEINENVIRAKNDIKFIYDYFTAMCDIATRGLRSHYKKDGEEGGE